MSIPMGFVALLLQNMLLENLGSSLALFVAMVLSGGVYAFLIFPYSPLFQQILDKIKGRINKNALP